MCSGAWMRFLVAYEHRVRCAWCCPVPSWRCPTSAFSRPVVVVCTGVLARPSSACTTECTIVKVRGTTKFEVRPSTLFCEILLRIRLLAPVVVCFFMHQVRPLDRWTAAPLPHECPPRVGVRFVQPRFHHPDMAWKGTALHVGISSHEGGESLFLDLTRLLMISVDVAPQVMQYGAPVLFRIPAL